jgi:hypothetical protein
MMKNAEQAAKPTARTNQRNPTPKACRISLLSCDISHRSPWRVQTKEFDLRAWAEGVHGKRSCFLFLRWVKNWGARVASKN